jgi:hypothetical protein
MFYSFRVATKQQKLGMIGLILIVIILLFVYLDVAITTPEIKEGTVTELGMDSTSKYELPRIIATIEIDNMVVKRIVIPRDVNIKVGEKVEIYVFNTLVTPGDKYTFRRKRATKKE